MERMILASRGRVLGTTSGGRRRRLFAALAAIVAIAAAFPALAGAAGTDTPSPSKSIWDYAVFGWQSVNFKGKVDASVKQGSIGVNDKGGVATVCANGALHMADHTQLVGDKLNISPLCTLYDVFYGTKPAKLGSITHHGDAQFTPPIDPIDVPVMPPPYGNSQFDCDKSGTKDITATGPKSMSITTPGVYGALKLKDGTIVHLGSGTYVFCSVSMGQQAWFDMQADTTVIVTQTMSIGNLSKVGHAAAQNDPGTNNSLVFVRGDNQWAQAVFPCETLPGERTGLQCLTTPHVNLAKHATVHATLFARNGNMNLGHDNDLFGHFWAKSITTDAAVRVTGETTTTSTVTSTSTTTTTFEATTTTQPG